MKTDYKDYIKKAFVDLKLAGANNIVIYFDGCGDSGSIEYVDIKKSDGELIKTDELTVEFPKEHSFYKDGNWITEVQIEQMPVSEALKVYCYDELEKTNIDWYNNDGGCGQMIINIDDKVEIELEVNQRYTEYNTYSFSLNEE
jgi:hypothetical protein